MNNTREQRSEARSINLSLHYLEKVILALRSGGSPGVGLASAAHGSGGTHAHAHIPYRNSVLTNMLRDSLGGNCKPCFVLTLSVDRLHFEETLSTCRFGMRCGEVKIKVSANVRLPLDQQVAVANARIELLVRKLREEKEAHTRTQQHHAHLLLLCLLLLRADGSGSR